MRLRGWSPERWAHEAGVAPTSITRAMQESYTGVSGTQVLHSLARAAGVPSPLDALDPTKTVIDLAQLRAALGDMPPAMSDLLRRLLESRES